MHFRLDSGEIDLDFIVSIEGIVKTDAALLFEVTVSCFELGLLGLESLIRASVFQQRSDQVLVNNVTLELGSGNDIAVAEL